MPVCLGPEAVGNTVSDWVASIVDVLSGNPTELSSLTKTETSSDWVSPKDKRFAVIRRYRSDSRFVENFPDAGNVRDGFAGLWRFDYDEMIQSGTVGLAAGQYVYTDNRGMRLFFDQTTFVANRAGHSFSMASAGSLLTVSDGSGVTKTFSQDSTGIYLLDDITWKDGYSINFERGTDDRLLAYEDNRGQRAEVSWTTTPTPNFTGPLISGIDIDTNYNGTTFAPEVELDYSYLEHPYIPERAAIGEVTITDVIASTTETQFKYTYGLDRHAYPPKLFTIRDGRLDSNGAEFDYATFGYKFEDLWADEVEWTEHHGGADRHEFSRLPDGRVSVKNPLNKETIYNFDGQGADRKLVDVEGVATSNCLGTAQSWTHDSNGFVADRIERNGSRTAFTRDARGYVLTKTEDADGVSPRVTSYTWDTVFRKPLTRTTAHLKETYTYDADGQMTSYTQEDVLTGSSSFGATRTWTYTYTALASGLKVLTSIDGPGPSGTVNDVTSFTHNTDGTLATSTDPNGLVTTYNAYSPLGQVTSLTGPDGIVWGFTYDIEGRVISATRNPSGANPSTTTFAYDAAGLLTSTTNSLGKTWSFEYDGARRLTKAINPLGDYASFAHDAMGNVTRTSQFTAADQEMFYQTAEFDELGRIMTAVGAETFGFSYDVEDNLIETTDAFGLARTQLHDALNRVISAVDEDGSTTLFEHDENDAITRYTDPRGIDTTTALNGFGEVVSETSADRGTMTYAHNARGLVTSMTDGRGVVTNYEYDDGGRLTAKRFPSDSTLDQVFTYGADGTIDAGKLVSVTEGSGSTARTHDADNGLPASKTSSLASADYATTFGYDSENQMTSVGYPSGGTVAYTWSDNGQIDGVTWQGGGIDPQTGQPYPPISIISNAIYLPNGPLNSLLFGDGTTLTETYDTNYQLVGQTGGVGGAGLRDVTYDWTARGNLAGVTNHLNTGEDQLLRYSLDRRLAQAGGIWGGIEYTYDAVGNRTSRSEGTVQQVTGGGVGSSGAGDPHWNDVKFLAGFETDANDESPDQLGGPTVHGPAGHAERRASAALMGNTGYATNADAAWHWEGRARYSGTADIKMLGTEDFTIEGFAKSNFNDNTRWRNLMGSFNAYNLGSWSISLTNNPNNRLVFRIQGYSNVYTTTDLNTDAFHFAVSRNGDTLRIFVNGVMEAKSSGWANRVVGNWNHNFQIGRDFFPLDTWNGYVDEIRITKGTGRYDSDAGFAVPTEPYPRGPALEDADTTGATAVSQHVPLGDTGGVATETANLSLGDEYANRHILVNVGWAGATTAEITAVTVDGLAATRVHRINGPATENAELWGVDLPYGTSGDVSVTWDAAVTNRHVTVLSAPLASLSNITVGSAIPDGSGGYEMSGIAIPSGGFVLGGSLGQAYVNGETALFSPSPQVFNWAATDQRSTAGSAELQTQVFSADNTTAEALTYDTTGPVPFYAVTFSPGSFLDPVTATTDSYSYGASDNRLASIAEASGHTRSFTYDAAGNTTYDNRSGGGYGYAYDAAGRMESFSINGVVQAEYQYNALGQQVVRTLTQTGEVIHNVFDLDGNRIAEYLYDAGTGSSTLIREYIWMNGAPVGVVEGGQVFYIRTDHIGRPVFATNDLGVKVWEASYLPFGGVVSAPGAIDLRFPGQWFQSESGLHQNWMRDYDPTTGRYLQADPLGLVDGASVYGYALQNPGRYTDPTGEFIPLVPIALGAGIGMATGYLFDQFMGDGCYTWQEALTDAAFGATGAGLGARYAWRFGPKSLTRETGKEWSHAVSRKTVEKYAERARDFVNRKSNRFPGAAAAAHRTIDRVARAMNKRGGYNGSWASPKRHFKHDTSRYPRGWRGMGKRFRPSVQHLDRIPDWIKFSFGGAAGSALGENAGMDALP